MKLNFKYYIFFLNYKMRKLYEVKKENNKLIFFRGDNVL